MTVPDTLVFDASVVVKLYIPERDSDRAVARMKATASPLAPDLLVAELGNILWKKTRIGELSGEEAAEIASAFTVTPPVSLQNSLALLPAAVELAVTYGRTVYDALYLALAVAEGCRLVTADERLVRALEGSPLETYVSGLTAL